MENQNIQNQIYDINQKLDLILHYVNEQRLKSEVLEDLVADVSIIGKDAFQTSVNELDKQGIELDTEEMKRLLFKFIRNISNFSQLMDTFESIADFLKDASPIFKEIIIDLINKLYEYERRGYFEYFSVTNNMLGEIHNHYTVDDFRKLTANVPLILGIFKNITQTEFLKSIENISQIVNNVKPDEKLDNKSLFKLLRELNSKEIRQSISYLLRVIKAVSPQNKINS